MASLAKRTKAKRNQRDQKIAKRRQKKTRTRERKLQQSSEILLSE